ncbi:ribonuclease HI family protein [Candidatus Gottesmanbacteria bacterium]|nr:ribonuclease HI family protein [Candidatus Gottesmanbacteria bacterium]
MANLIVHTDGGARGNPGSAAIGVVIQTTSGNILHQVSRTIGETTNNIAEYQAVVEALTFLQENIPNATFSHIDAIKFFLDSTLVVNQLNGLFKVKEPMLREYLLKVRTLEQGIGKPITYTYVPREKNAHADRLVNNALDGQRYF